MSNVVARVLLEAARAALSELGYMAPHQGAPNLLMDIRTAQGRLDIATRDREPSQEEAKRCMAHITILLAYAGLEAENAELIPARLTQEARRYAKCI